MGRIGLVFVCVLTIWIYAAIIRDVPCELGMGDASKAYYNLLVDGFRSGQLSLKKTVPPGLGELADPYDPIANREYRSMPYRIGSLHDLSYYHGRLFLYFGITPALVLFWPAVAVTGHYIDHPEAVFIFGALGFLISIGLLYAMWRRYFPRVGVGVVIALVSVLGLGNSMPLLLTRPDVWEVPISCAYAMVMLALAALWGAWHQPLRRALWLALASLAYGLAVGARPSLLFGAVILLGPIIQTWNSTPAGKQRWREIVRMAGAAFGPICVIGGGLLLYNYLRFGNPFEFGQSYQLAGDRQDNIQHFSLDNLGLNGWMYFLAPAEWSRYFPFLDEIFAPDGDGRRIAYGVLTNMPFSWLALAAPLAWRCNTLELRSGLRWFVVSVAVLFGLSALLMGLFYGTCLRYETEFVPALIWLAVVGWLGVEHCLIARPRWLVAFRWLGGALLAYSVAFNLLYCCVLRSNWLALYAGNLINRGEPRQAIVQLEKAVRFRPDYDAVHLMLVVAYCQENQLAAAEKQFEKALKFAEPEDVALCYYSYGWELLKKGQLDKGLAVFQAGLARVPDSAELNRHLGETLVVQGRKREARPYLEAALRLHPKDANTHYNLGILLAEEGRPDEAIEHWKQTLQLNPEMRDAHFNLGAALLEKGLVQEAISQYEEVLRLDPNCESVRETLRQLGRSIPSAQ